MVKVEPIFILYVPYKYKWLWQVEGVQLIKFYLTFYVSQILTFPIFVFAILQAFR